MEFRSDHNLFFLILILFDGPVFVKSWKESLIIHNLGLQLKRRRSFLWTKQILKTECIYRAKPRTYEEARLLIGDYIHFYNYQRIQLKTKLTPMEYRRQFVAWKLNLVS